MHDASIRPGGSHAFSSHPSQERELERLRRQALVVWPLEERWLMHRGLTNGMRVLDVGCGPGFVSEKLAALNPGGETVGLEPDPELARLANAVFDVRPELSLCQGTLASNDLPDNHFDFAYARFVVQHLAAPVEDLRNLHRLLKPGGHVVLVDADDGLTFVYPEPPELREFMRLSETVQAQAGGDRRVGRKLPALLTEAGFTDVGFEVLPVTSHELGRRALFDLAVSFRLRRVEHAADGDVIRLAEDVKRFFAEREWYGVACIVAAFGVRP